MIEREALIIELLHRDDTVVIFVDPSRPVEIPPWQTPVHDRRR